jgi:hypothetical protein
MSFMHEICQFRNILFKPKASHLSGTGVGATSWVDAKICAYHHMKRKRERESYRNNVGERKPSQATPAMGNNSCSLLKLEYHPYQQDLPPTDIQYR